MSRLCTHPEPDESITVLVVLIHYCGDHLSTAQALVVLTTGIWGLVSADLERGHATPAQPFIRATCIGDHRILCICMHIDSMKRTVVVFFPVAGFRHVLVWVSWLLVITAPLTMPLYVIITCTCVLWGCSCVVDLLIWSINFPRTRSSGLRRPYSVGGIFSCLTVGRAELRRSRISRGLFSNKEKLKDRKLCDSSGEGN